jgi:hypothetical protein
MKDGVYQVNWQGISAGFVVENGEVTQCAPVLRRRFPFFSRIARRISTESKNKTERQTNDRDDGKTSAD